MTDKPIGLAPINPERAARRRETAEWLRELADRVDEGEIPDVVVVFNDLVERGYVAFGDFQDRWRLLGAIEYAKSVVP